MKEISWKKVILRIGLLYLCFLVFFALLFIFIRNYQKINYSDEGLRKAMLTPSSMRDITDDPCAYSIIGDPLDVGKKYAKVNIYCLNGKHSSNSIDLRVINGGSIFDLLAELGRINGFKVTTDKSSIVLGGMTNIDEVKRWSCYIGTDKIIDYNDNVPDSSNIECFYGLTEKELKIFRDEIR